MIHNIDGERTTTTVHMRAANWGDKGWYHNLAAHELAHAWDRRNLPGFVGPWSSEGIANWFADENSRLATNTPLDANWDVEVPLRGFRLRMPWYGNFLLGYNESHPYLRFLVTRLVFDHGQSYASATRRVIGGAAEDWYGHYFTDWNHWDRRGKGPGLIERMREVVPGWDPIRVTAGLDGLLCSRRPRRRAPRVRYTVCPPGMAVLPSRGRRSAVGGDWPPEASRQRAGTTTSLSTTPGASAGACTWR